MEDDPTLEQWLNYDQTYNDQSSEDNDEGNENINMATTKMAGYIEDENPPLNNTQIEQRPYYYPPSTNLQQNYENLSTFFKNWYLIFFGYLAGYHRYIVNTRKIKKPMFNLFKSNNDDTYYYTTTRKGLYTLDFEVSTIDNNYNIELALNIKDIYRSTDEFNYLNLLNPESTNFSFVCEQNINTLLTSKSIPTLALTLFLFARDPNIETLTGIFNLNTQKQVTLNRSNYFLFGFTITEIRNALNVIFDRSEIPDNDNELYKLIKTSLSLIKNISFSDKNSQYIDFAVNYFNYKI